MGNLSDFEPSKHAVAADKLAEMDKYMLGKLDNLIAEVRAAYTEFNFRRAMRAITDFCILDLSAFMLDASKDRLYTLGASSPARRSAQTALVEIVRTLLQLLAPVLCFTCEEAWQELLKLPCGKELAKSIFLSDMPQKASVVAEKALAEKWNHIRQIREEVLKALEETRQKGTIGSALEAEITLRTNDVATQQFLTENAALWPEIFIVSAVKVEEGKQPLEVAVAHAAGQKCARCWQWKPEVGTSGRKHEDLCDRCTAVLEREGLTVSEE